MNCWTPAFAGVTELLLRNRYNSCMNKIEKLQRIVLIILGVLASGYFMYSGFSMLMHDESNDVNATQGLKQLDTNFSK